MTVAASNAEFGIAPQASGKLGSATFVPASYTWRRYKVTRVGFGTQQVQQNFPQEIGGGLTPTGAYKGGVFMAGEVDMLPRVNNVMGFLFYALMGNVSSVTGKDMHGATVTGANTHIFNYNATNTVPWFSAFKKIPGATASDAFGETAVDCVATSLRLQMNAAGKLTARMGFTGRRPFYEENPSRSWNNSLEDHTTVPEACNATFALGANAPAVLSATLEINNQMSNPQQEMIIGSLYPDDFIPLQRTATIRIVTKWANPDLLQLVLTGSSSGTTWSSTPYETTSAGVNWGFLMQADAPSTIGGSSPTTAYSFAVRANKVTWLPNGPTELTAGGMVTQEFVGTVSEPSSGDYLQIVLQNGQTSYTWT